MSNSGHWVLHPPEGFRKALATLSWATSLYGHLIKAVFVRLFFTNCCVSLTAASIIALNPLKSFGMSNSGHYGTLSPGGLSKVVDALPLASGLQQLVLGGFDESFSSERNLVRFVVAHLMSPRQETLIKPPQILQTPQCLLTLTT